MNYDCLLMFCSGFIFGVYSYQIQLAWSLLGDEIMADLKKRWVSRKNIAVGKS